MLDNNISSLNNLQPLQAVTLWAKGWGNCVAGACLNCGGWGGHGHAHTTIVDAETRDSTQNKTTWTSTHALGYLMHLVSNLNLFQVNLITLHFRWSFTCTFNLKMNLKSKSTSKLGLSSARADLELYALYYTLLVNTASIIFTWWRISIWRWTVASHTSPNTLLKYTASSIQFHNIVVPKITGYLLLTIPSTLHPWLYRPNSCSTTYYSLFPLNIYIY